MKKVLSLLSVLMLFCALAYGQTRTVTGTVRDEKGEPIPFATITEAGTKNAVQADANGNYSIKIPENARLTITASGFTAQTMASANAGTIQLVRSEGPLTEVVVTALQTRRNRNEVVYANQTVRNEDLNEVVNRSALNALQGKVSGVKIVQASGAPGASTRVVLRGETSLTGGNNALIVVDGVPLNNSSAAGGGGTGKLGDRDNYVDFGNRANDINPDDIESMSVLKGPAATSLYGSRGASGVILITTKKGRASNNGRPRISVGSSVSTERPYLVMKQQERFGSGYKSCNGCGGGIDIFMGENFSWGAELDGRLIPWTAVPADEDGHLIPLNNGKIEQLVRPYSYVENHLADFFDNGVTNRNNVSFDGGTNNYKYFVSYTNFNNKGIIPHTNYYKNNILFNGSANFTEKLTSTFSLNYSKISQRGATEGGYPFGYSSGTPAYSFALQTPVNIPFSELRDYNSPYHDFKGFYGQYSINPYFILDQQNVSNNVDNVLASLALNYQLFKNFTLTGRASTNFSNSSVTENNPQFQYFRALSWSDGELSDFESPRENLSLGSYKESVAKRNDLNFDVLGTYSTQINSDFKVSATAGFNSIQQQVRVVGGSTSGGLVIPGFYDLSNSTERAVATNASSKYRLFGAYLNTSVGFKNMLFLEYSARNDWSSTLPKGNRTFFYQAGGVSFIPTNQFNIKNDVLNYLKIRGNVGTTGKDAPLYRLDNYFGLNPLILDYGDDYQIQLPFNGQPGSQRSNTIGNPNLKPELTVTYEGGVDVGLFKDRLNIEYTYYYSDSKDQIVDVNLPWSSGFAIYPLNIGRMVNKGHELAIRATPVKNKLIDWRVFVTFSKNDNTVKSIADEYGLKELNIYTGLVHFSGHGTLNLVATEGLPFGTFKGTDFVYDPSGNMVVDGTGNPKQSAEQNYLGSYQPDYTGSFGTDFNIKGFSLHALFDGKKGGLFFSGTKMSTEFNGTAATTIINDRQPYVIPNSVVEDGTTFKANTKQTAAYNYFKATPASSYLLDASYLKLRELSLSYTIPSKIINSTPFSGVTIGVFAKNLKYWLPEENTFADPEVGGVGGASDAVGIETTTTPTTRSFGVDLRLNFK
jgi:TonB-linked SusC/RagA family outer membrane protein